MSSTYRLPHIAESTFGKWFLSTQVWETRVLDVAIDDLSDLIPGRRASYPIVVDLGCGSGKSFVRLHERFSPEQIIGIDIDAEMLRLSTREAEIHGLKVALIRGNCSLLPLPDASVDMLFCHQTYHHLIDQEGAMKEFHRVLRSGGVLLFGESTRSFIHSWIIRLLFRHPMDVQKSAPEYLEIIRRMGFEVGSGSTSFPYLWWSRKDFGIGERLLGYSPEDEREETMMNVAAIRRSQS